MSFNNVLHVSSNKSVNSLQRNDREATFLFASLAPSLSASLHPFSTSVEGTKCAFPQLHKSSWGTKTSDVTDNIFPTSKILDRLLIQDRSIQPLVIECRQAKEPSPGTHMNANMKNRHVPILRQRQSLLSKHQLVQNSGQNNSEILNWTPFVNTELSNEPRLNLSHPMHILQRPGLNKIDDIFLSTADAKRKGRRCLFPQKLHTMLSDLEKQPGGTDIASFLPHGLAFKIHKPEEFLKHVIPQYFSMSSIASFQRQMRMYNFEQISIGMDKGAYYHQFFIRGQPALCNRIKRLEQMRKQFLEQNTSGN